MEKSFLYWKLPAQLAGLLLSLATLLSLFVGNTGVTKRLYSVSLLSHFLIFGSFALEKYFYGEPTGQKKPLLFYWMSHYSVACLMISPHQWIFPFFVSVMIISATHMGFDLSGPMAARVAAVLEVLTFPLLLFKTLFVYDFDMVYFSMNLVYPYFLILRYIESDGSRWLWGVVHDRLYRRYPQVARELKETFSGLVKYIENYNENAF